MKNVMEAAANTNLCTQACPINVYTEDDWHGFWVAYLVPVSAFLIR